MQPEQGLQGASVENDQDKREGSGPNLRVEKGDGEKKDNETGAGRAWRSGKTKATAFFLEGPWRGLAALHLLSVENSWERPQATKLYLFLGFKSGVNWQERNEDLRFKPGLPCSTWHLSCSLNTFLLYDYRCQAQPFPQMLGLALPPRRAAL